MDKKHNKNYNGAIRLTDTMKIERLIIIVAIASIVIGLPIGAALKQRAVKLNSELHSRQELQSSIERVQKQLELKAKEADTKASDVQKLQQEKAELEQKLQSKAKSNPIVGVARAAEGQAVTPPVVASSDIGSLLVKHFGAAASQAQVIMNCESGGVPTKHNFNPNTGDDSWGLFQINRYGALALTRPAPDWLAVAENNISYAAGMHKRSGWSPWYNCARKAGLI